MKAILAVVTLALVALVVEEKARQIAGDTHDAYGEMVDQARGATETLSKKIEQKPLIALLIAGSLGYLLASLIPRRKRPQAATTPQG
jgi:hypothetical protein